MPDIQMKFAISILLSALLAYAAGLYLPWWSISLATGVVALIVWQKPLAAFLSGFIALFLLWLILVVRINALNEGILAPKISMIMGIGSSGTMLILLSCVLGGLVGGMGALCGSLLASWRISLKLKT